MAIHRIHFLERLLQGALREHACFNSNVVGDTFENHLCPVTALDVFHRPFNNRRISALSGYGFHSVGSKYTGQLILCVIVFFFEREERVLVYPGQLPGKVAEAFGVLWIT